MGNYSSVIEGQPTELKAQTIDIIFENKNTKISVGDEVGEYYSHPAFQAFDTNGLWVAKFETSGEINNLKVKPNVIALRSIDIKTMFNATINYKKINESHMMKNTEWGAAAYLSHSKYGINKEININNNQHFKTGYSAVVGTNQSIYPGTYGLDSSVTLPYNTGTGYLASTTGNISGIYDMSGGSYEYVSTYINGNNTKFDEEIIKNYSEKYFDIYNNSLTFSNRILGDATGELGPFYIYKDNDDNSRYHNSWWSDNSFYFNAENNYLGRGGYFNSGILAGQFGFRAYPGQGFNFMSFRLILTK
jgi:hypothetical protein